jgi:benzoyl-CoA reductase/2-hydroxyglutaryl-CoA dehydratase subunit BcrC/BadD/HgdB
VQRVFALWARAFDAPFVALDNTGATHLPPRWWELSRYAWEELYEAHRLDFMVEELRYLISKIEETTGRRFELERLRVLMAAINEQEEYFEEPRELIYAAPQTPVRMNEQVQNVMTTQWHRGSAWAVNHARAFRDEIRQRVAQGVAAVPNERIRLMWIGAGLWHDTAFYTAQSALGNEWIVEQARRHRIDGALLLVPRGSRPAATGTYFTARALEAAGIPTLQLWADMVDARQWDGAAARASHNSSNSD